MLYWFRGGRTADWCIPQMMGRGGNSHAITTHARAQPEVALQQAVGLPSSLSMIVDGASSMMAPFGSDDMARPRIRDHIVSPRLRRVSSAKVVRLEQCGG